MPRNAVAFGQIDSGSGFFCAQCGQNRDREGRLCRRCLRRRVIKGSIATIVAVEFAVAGALAALRLGEQQKPGVVAAAPSVLPPPPAPGPSGWMYYDTADSLLADVTHHARLLGNSPPSVGGKPGIPGAVAGMLALAASPHYGNSVVVTFPKTPVQCSPGKCAVKAIFDQTEPVVFPVQDAQSDRETTVMLGDYDRFTARLRVAHDLTLVASLGGPHDVIMNFTVQGYREALWSTRLRYAALFQCPA